MDTTVTSNSEPVEQGSNNQPNSSPADNMVPWSSVEAVLRELGELKASMAAMAEDLRAKEAQIEEHNKAIPSGQVKPLSDIALRGLCNGIPHSGAKDQDIAGFIRTFKLSIQEQESLGVQNLRTYLVSLLARSTRHFRRFIDIEDEMREVHKFPIGIPWPFKDFLRLIDKFAESLRPTAVTALIAVRNVKFDPRSMTGEAFIQTYRDALEAATPEGMTVAEYEQAQVTNVYGALVQGARDAGLQAHVQTMATILKDKPYTMATLTSTVRDLFSEPIGGVPPQQENLKLLQMKPRNCYHCREVGHIIRFCPKLRRMRSRERAHTSEGDSDSESDKAKKKRAKFGDTGGATKTDKSKTDRRLLVLSFQRKLTLVDTGAECSVLFSSNVDWTNKKSVSTRIDTLGGTVSARVWLEPYEILPNVWLPQITVVEDMPLTVHGGDKIDVVLGLDAIYQARGFNLWFDDIDGQQLPCLKFHFSPNVYLISEDTIEVEHKGAFYQFQILNDVTGNSRVIEETVLLPEWDLEDVHACPPGSTVVEQIDCKDFRLSVVKPPTSSTLRLVVKYKTKANKGIKRRIGRGHYFDRLESEDLELVLAKIKEWIKQGRCVPVEYQYVKSIIPVFCVLQKHKETTPARPVFNAAININLDILSYPSDDVGSAPHCANRIRLIRAMPELDTSIDVRGYYLGFWNNPEQSFYLCLHLPGLGLPSDYWRMVGMPFGLSSAPKIGQVGMAYMLKQAELEKTVVDYVDDLFLPSSVATRVTEILLRYGFECKPPTPVDNHQFLGIKTKEGQMYRLKRLQTLSEISNGVVTLQAVRSFLGRLLAHYPIAGWLRPWCGLIPRVVAMIRRFDMDKVREQTTRISSKLQMKEMRLQAKQWEERPDEVVHPIVVRLCNELECALEKRGDPVVGQLHFDILGDIQLWIDASMFAMGAKVYVGGVLVEDGSWMLPAGHSMRIYSDHHINVNESEAAVVGLKLVKRLLETETEYRRRRGLPMMSGRKVTICSDSHSWCSWIKKVLKEEDPRVPELSRRLVNHRLAQFIEACQRLKISVNIVWVPGTSNKADEMTRVPESVLKMIADELSEMGCAQTVVHRVLAMTMSSAEVQSPIKGSANPRLAKWDSISPFAAALTEGNLTINDDEWVDPSSGVHRVDPERVMTEYLRPDRDTRVGQTSGNPFIGLAVETTDAADGVDDESGDEDVEDVVRASKVLAIFRDTVPQQFLFDNLGRTVVNEVAVLGKIFRGVHMHEGADSLFRVVREIISSRSPVFGETRSSLREQCRKFVQECEACQMCRRNSKQPVEVLARSPIQVSVHGEQIPLTQEQVMNIERCIKFDAMKKKLKQSDKRSSMSGSAPWEKLSMDIIGPWTVGADRVWFITGMDTFSQFLKIRGFINVMPTALDCALFLTEFVREGRVIPLIISVDNGSTFVAKVFKAAAEQMGSEIQYVGAYYHERLIERMHRVINERTRAAIHELRRRKQREQGLVMVAMAVSVQEVVDIVHRVVLYWNVAPRAKRQSPHSLIFSYPAWVYQSINEYRPQVYQFPVLQKKALPVVGKNAPKQFELWRVAVKEGEHAAANVDDVLSNKLKPNHVYGRVVKILEAGRYLMKLEGMAKCVPKQRKQLISKCIEELLEQEILDRNPVVYPEEIPLVEMDESDMSIAVESSLVRQDHPIDVPRIQPLRTRKRPQRIFGDEFTTEV